MQLSLRMLYQVAVHKPYLPEIFLILDEKVFSISYDYKHTSNGIASYLDGSWHDCPAGVGYVFNRAMYLTGCVIKPVTFH